MNQYEKLTIVPQNGVIDKPGNYFLASDFISKDMFAIKIECNDVNLNLNDFAVITDIRDQTKTTFGVYAISCSNVSVFNGSISGSSIGVHAAYGEAFSARLLSINGCTNIGINIGGANPFISNCYIRNIGGNPEEAYAVGINSSDAQNASIMLNRIENIYRQNVSPEKIGEGVAILLGHDTKDCLIANNTILNNEYQRNTYGLWAVGRRHLIANNMFCNAQYGVYMGLSELVDNIIMLKTYQSESFSISGGMGTAFRNTIINYEKDYNYVLQEEVTENIPFITD